MYRKLSFAVSAIAGLFVTSAFATPVSSLALLLQENRGGQSGSQQSPPQRDVDRADNDATMNPNRENMTRNDPDRVDMGTDNRSGMDNKYSQVLRQIRQSPEQAADKLFVLYNSMSDQFAVEFARVAQEKAQDPQIKQLAQRIIQDHSQGNQQLMQVARQLQLDLPQQLGADKREVLEIFRSLPVDQFETCYIVENKAWHVKKVTSFTDHQKTVRSEELRQYVSQQLPKLKEHTSQIIQVAQAKGIGEFPQFASATGGMGIDGSINQDRPDRGMQQNPR
jgi:putative membrane protein